MDSDIPLGHVLVTGGCGFLGHHIVNLLLERDPEVRISVLDLRTTHNRNLNSQVSYYDGDITDYSKTKSLFETLRPDVVIHTASPHFNLSPDILLKVNLDGTKVLLQGAQETGVKAFVYTSSASIIHDGKNLINADERWPLAYAESAVLAANRSDAYPNFLTCAIRPAGIFGEGDVQSVPKMITAYHKGQTKFQIGDNNNLFDFTYVGNVAHAHLLAASALLVTAKMAPQRPLDHETVDGEPFLITNGQPVYFWDFARTIWREAGDKTLPNQVWVLSTDMMWAIGAVLEGIFWVMGKTPNLTRQQAKYSSITRYYNIDKAKRRLGYKPIVDLQEGIRRAVQYIIQEEKKQGEKKAQ
ncbi:hypothetical protein M501DRAFT_1019048 [Patellaria atrata CBS 101060]|uniref:Sterol-4-alpha-carboxylate 3-dehydrogenase ERG26, decarboxylating n=1 Tax=Patellaria atrata CBS 101060 TaxID=1346257 RepID=A0A9P4VKD1_9PEZI|nr:hypothetical protein M501DRAFT_1019048 [Patellaria atrata CBS 101060]